MNFDEGYDSDDERGPWCDVIGLEGEKYYDEDDIPEIQVEGVIKKEDVNINEACPIDTDRENKETEYPPPLPVEDHIPLKKML